MLDVPVVLLSVLSILFGASFANSFGLRTSTSILLRLIIWSVCLMSAFSLYKALGEGEWLEVFTEKRWTVRMRTQYHDAFRGFVRLLSIALLTVSAVALFQVFRSEFWQGFPAALAAGVYLFAAMPIWMRGWGQWVAFYDITLSLTLSFLLPSVVISLSGGAIKSSLMAITFPMFLQLIAWNLNRGLGRNLRESTRDITSLASAFSAADCLVIIASLLSLSTILFIGNVLPGYTFSALADKSALVVLPIMILSGVAVFCLVKALAHRNPYWQIAHVIIHLLPFLVFGNLILPLLY